MIYVDELKKYKGSYWCHMMTNDDIEMLHKFAKRLGLSKRWFQNHPYHPHYDLSSSKRALALKLGAKDVDSKKMIELCTRILYDATGS